MKALYTLALAALVGGCATSRVTIQPATSAPTKQEAAEVLRTQSFNVEYLRNRALRNADVDRVKPLAAVYAGIGRMEKTNDGFTVVLPEKTSLATDQYEAALEAVLTDADRNKDDIITLPELFWLSRNIYENNKAGRQVNYIPPEEKAARVAKAPEQKKVAPAPTKMVAKPTVAADASAEYKKQAAYVQRSPLKTHSRGYTLLENNLNSIETIAGIYAGVVKINKKGDQFFVQKSAGVRIPESYRLKALKDADTIVDRIITPMELRKLVLDVYNQSAQGVAVRGPTQTQDISRDLVARVQKEEQAKQPATQQVAKQPVHKTATKQARKQQALISKEEKAKREKRKQKRGWRNFYFRHGKKR